MDGLCSYVLCHFHLNINNRRVDSLRRSGLKTTFERDTLQPAIASRSALHYAEFRSNFTPISTSVVEYIKNYRMRQYHLRKKHLKKSSEIPTFCAIFTKSLQLANQLKFNNDTNFFRFIYNSVKAIIKNIINYQNTIWKNQYNS